MCVYPYLADKYVTSTTTEEKQVTKTKHTKKKI